jgi:hypothetical protein
MDHDDDESQLVNRADAARILGATKSTVRRHEEAGRLVPVDAGPNNGERLFRRDDVSALRAAPRSPPIPSAPLESVPRPARAAQRPELDGETAAQLFELFDAGCAPVAVVISERLPPAVVEAAWAAYGRLRRLAALSPQQAAYIANLEAEVSHWRAVHGYGPPSAPPVRASAYLVG